MERIVLEAQAPVRALRGPVLGQLAGQLLGEQRIVGAQAGRRLGEVGVAPRFSLAHPLPGVEPEAHPVRHRLRLIGRAHALEHGQAVNALRIAAGVVGRHTATHGVADQRHPRAADLADQVVEVGQVVDEVVVAARPDPVAVAVPAQVGRDEVEPAGEPGARGRRPAPRQVEESVQQDDGVVEGGLVAAPLEDVIGEPGPERDAPRDRFWRRAHSTSMRRPARTNKRVIIR